MSRNLTVLVSVLILTAGINFPVAYSVNQPEGFSKKEKKQIEKIVKNVLTKSYKMKRGKSTSGAKTIRFEGVNVQVVNGLNRTDLTNGTGNLIIGYDTASVTREKTGSHNLVVGNEHTYTSYGGVVFGFRNEISAASASVTGGSDNTASRRAAHISGGSSNKASGEHSSVSGGYLNTASGLQASISGGERNTAGPGWNASVSGGNTNTASGYWSSIVGGIRNQAGDYDSVAGGSDVGCDVGNAIVCGEGQNVPNL